MPRRAETGFTIAALLLAAAAPARGQMVPDAPHLVDPRPEIPAGRLEQHVLFDSSYHRDRRIWIYTPPGYDPRSGNPYPLIVAFDGNDYRDTMPLPTTPPPGSASPTWATPPA